MGKSGHFIHRVVKEGLTVNANTTYNIANVVEINLNDVRDGSSQQAIKRASKYTGNIQLIRIKCTTNAGTPTAITLKGYEDSAGSKLILPASSSVLEPSLDGNSHAVSFLCNVYHASGNDELYLFLKTNSGSVIVNEVQVTWFE